LASDHKVVALSITSIFASAVIIFGFTLAYSGGFSIVLFKQYVLPLFISAFTLGIFWAILFTSNRREKRNQPQPQPQQPQQSQQ
jgi:uncharacterized RDD family membrane protein YckC